MSIMVGDCRKMLRQIERSSIQTCITSPPYFGLRDYGTASWDGGEPECKHTISMDTKWNDPKRGTAVLRPEVSGRGGSADACHLCGATRLDSQIGLEPTPEAYVAEMVALFREVWQVLADNGTLWLNLGDSYWNNFGGGSSSMTTGNAKAVKQRGRHNMPKHDLFKMKDLIGIPWRVAFALQADGWYLRQDIIWAKPNPMPESVTDRCTKSHEYVFLLSKSPRYYYDHEAIKEESVTNVGNSQIRFGGSKYGDNDDPRHATKSGNVYNDTGKRNKRDVWTINTKPFKGAHFAVMPEALVEPCILAGSAPGDTVLDPFAGSGTVGVVAKRHGRQFVGVELNPEYAAMAEERINGEPDRLFTTLEGSER